MIRSWKAKLILALTAASLASAAPSRANEQGGANPKPEPTMVAKLDLNTASSEQLQTLPGVDSMVAAKIIANRPYQALGQLTRAGLTPMQISKLAPQVMVSNPSLPGAKAPYAPRPSATATHQLVSSGPIPPAPKTAPGTFATPVPKIDDTTGSMEPGTGTKPKATEPMPPGKANPVWAERSTRLYYRVGDPHYGKSKGGQYMTEEAAKKAGYREAKPPADPREPSSH